MHKKKVINFSKMTSAEEVDAALTAKQTLMLALGDKWPLYLANMKLWFRKKTRRAVSPKRSVNSYGAESSHASKSGSSKKRKRSSKSSADRATFEPTAVHDYIPQELLDYEQVASQSATIPTIRYAAQELFLPNNGLVLGRLLVGAWENGLINVDENVVEQIVHAVQVQLKNILMAVFGGHHQAEALPDDGQQDVCVRHRAPVSASVQSEPNGTGKNEHPRNCSITVRIRKKWCSCYRLDSSVWPTNIRRKGSRPQLKSTSRTDPRDKFQQPIGSVPFLTARIKQTRRSYWNY